MQKLTKCNVIYYELFNEIFNKNKKKHGEFFAKIKVGSVRHKKSMEKM